MQKTFINTFSYMRIIACFAIILLHCFFSTSVYFEAGMSYEQKIWTQTIENLLMWAVPIFLMITGALLLEPSKETPFKKIKKYVFRVFAALVVFTLIFQLLEVIFEEEKSILTEWIYKLFTGQSWAHMWYLYLMIGLYLMIPFYKMVVNRATKRQLEGLIIILIFFISILPMCKIFGIQTGFYIPTGTIYPVYLFLGYYIYKNPISRKISMLLIIISTVIIISLTCYQLLKGSDYEWLSNISFGYDSVFVILQSVGIYSLFIQRKFEENKIIDRISDYTFGIYLIHMIFIRMIFKWYGFNPYKGGEIISVIIICLTGLAIFVISLLLTGIIKTADNKLL